MFCPFNFKMEIFPLQIMQLFIYYPDLPESVGRLNHWHLELVTTSSARLILTFWNRKMGNITPLVLKATCSGSSLMQSSLHYTTAIPTIKIFIKWL